MEHLGVLLSEIDKNFMFIYLGFDILNEGKLGTQINDDKERRWRIYGKDENSFLIAPIFNDCPYNSYNNGAERNSQNGIVVRRQRPKEEAQIGNRIKGKVILVSPQEWYIIKTDGYCVGVKRNTLYYFGGTIEAGDIVFADLHTKGNTSISNITRGTTQHHVIVKCMFNDYQSCYNWMIEHAENE